MNAEQISKVSRRIVNKAVRIGFPVGETPIEQSGKAMAVSMMLRDMQEGLETSGATAAYAAMLPEVLDERTPVGFMTLNVVVDLPPGKPDGDNIKALDSIVEKNKRVGLFDPRVGEPVDFGLGRVHGRELQKALKERYGGEPFFTQIYPTPTSKR